jgi:hemolysin III
MPLVATHRPAYSRAEFVSDAVVHLAGLAMALMAVPVLIVLTATLRGDGPALLGVTVYGVAMVAMIGCSALYNMTPGTARAWLYQRLDHSAIYIKIAGTYTPFTLLSGHGLALTAGVWGAAALGVGLKILSPERFRWAALALYLGMGWAGIVAGQALIAALPGPVLALMVAGGILYTAGVAFYLWERLPFHTTIWHVFVLTATFVFYAAVVTLVVLGTG